MKTILSSIVILCTFISVAHAAVVEDYRVISPPLSSEGNILIRSFKMDKKIYYLAVDPFTLEAKLNEQAQKLSPISEREKLSPYISALSKYSTPPYKIQNHGVVHSETPVKGYFLTVDLCPSRKPLDKRVFLSAVKKESSTVPHFAIAVTGKWIETHPDDFRWLKELSFENKISITWINHSYNHPFKGGVPLQKDFLLSDGINFTKELLSLEKKLLENGVTPSVFFRFPGLVSDEKLIKELAFSGIIPIGSDAWLAKGEIPAYGSIILVHGNGNEPQGVEKLLKLFKSQLTAERALPLKSALTQKRTGDKQ